MVALVTGGSGFIGSHVVDLLISKGYDVRCIVRKTSNLQWLKDKPVELFETSLFDIVGLEKAVKDTDYIFHIAGLTFARNYEEFVKGNRDGTRNIIEAAYKNSPNLKRFLFVSSLTVTGPAKSLDEPVTEQTECKPITAYGKSKKLAEDEILKFKEKIPITIVRAPAVYGPRDTAIFSVFKTVNAGLATMVGLKPKYLSLIHSTDLSRGILESAFSEKTIGETYFVSSEEFYTWDLLIPLMSKLMNKKFVLKLKLPHFIVLTAAGLTEFFGHFAKKPPIFNYEKGIDFIQDYWTCSIDKAKKDFAYEQKVSIEEGMKNTIDWYKENKWL
ncbi:MAG: NAD-dependent epimerase/dehydratase family protein [bacterium]